MIQLTRLDGASIFINVQNIQWLESLPDTAITFLGGARLLVKEKLADVLALIEARTNLSATNPSATSKA